MAYQDKWFDGEPMRITIKEEETSVDFYTPKALLTARSKYFGALPNFKEGQENHITFTTWSIKAFRYVLTWMYQGRVSVLGDDLRTMLRAYAIADFLMISQLKNNIVENIQELYDESEFTLEALGIFGTLRELNIPVADNLMQFFIDMAAYGMSRDFISRSETAWVVSGMRSMAKEDDDILMAIMEKFLCEMMRG